MVKGLSFGVSLPNRYIGDDAGQIGGKMKMSTKLTYAEVQSILKAHSSQLHELARIFGEDNKERQEDYHSRAAEVSSLYIKFEEYIKERDEVAS